MRSTSWSTWPPNCLRIADSVWSAKRSRPRELKREASAVKSTGAVVSGPIPLPTNKKIYTVLRGPHVDKKSREQFETRSHKRLIDILSTSTKTVDALMKLELPSGVDVEIKV